MNRILREGSGDVWDKGKGKERGINYGKEKEWRMKDVAPFKRRRVPRTERKKNSHRYSEKRSWKPSQACSNMIAVHQYQRGLSIQCDIWCQREGGGLSTFFDGMYEGLEMQRRAS